MIFLAGTFSVLALNAVLAFGLPPRSSEPPPPPAKAERPPDAKPRPLLAAAEVAAVNLGVWAVLHYPGDQYYTYVSWRTFVDNVRFGLRWDHSRYDINFLHHPYHGALYFSAGRACGLDYWGSTLAALGGSLHWEFVCENVGPALNDLLTTTLGGSAIGEVCHRLAALARPAKPEPAFLERAWRESLAAVLDPVGAANRVLNGRRDDDPALPGGPDRGRLIDGQFYLASRAFARGGDPGGQGSVPILGLVLRYGGAAGAGWAGRPFDVFSIDARLRPGPDRPHLSLDVRGALLGRKISGRGEDAHFLGLYQHYDYYGLDTLRLAAASFTAGWTSRFAPRPGLRLTAAARLGWLTLGASDDFAGHPEDRRSYSLAMGLAAAAEASLELREREILAVGWRHYGLIDLDLLPNLAGREAWDILRGRMSVPVRGGIGLGVEGEYCSRSFDFRDAPPGRRRLFEARIFVCWQY